MWTCDGRIICSNEVPISVIEYKVSNKIISLEIWDDSESDLYIISIYNIAVILIQCEQ